MFLLVLNVIFQSYYFLIHGHVLCSMTVKKENSMNVFSRKITIWQGFLYNEHAHMGDRLSLTVF